MPSNTDDVILSNCTILTNQKEAYDEERVVGMAIREDGMPASVVVRVTVSEESSAENFTRLTNCTLPQQGQWSVVCGAWGYAGEGTTVR